MNDTVWVISPEGEFLEVNNSAVKKLGYKKEELLKMSPKDIDANLKPEKINELINTVKEDQVQVFETKHETKKGELIPVEISSTTIKYQGKDAILSIARDITKRKETQEKEKFLHSLLRHDVGNKNQITEGYLELAQEYQIPEEARKYIEKAQRATKNSINIIKKVKTLNQLEQKQKIENIDICKILRRTAKEERKVLEINKIEINCQKPEIIVKGGSLLRQLFTNLIENSVKHGNSKKIKITVKEKQNKISCKMEDDGKGIPQKHRDRIFKKGFKKGKESGTGIGMYLVKKIAETYNAKIEIKNRKPNGTIFNMEMQKPDNQKTNAKNKK